MGKSCAICEEEMGILGKKECQVCHKIVCKKCSDTRVLSSDKASSKKGKPSPTRICVNCLTKVETEPSSDSSKGKTNSGGGRRLSDGTPAGEVNAKDANSAEERERRAQLFQKRMEEERNRGVKNSAGSSSTNNKNNNNNMGNSSKNAPATKATEAGVSTGATVNNNSNKQQLTEEKRGENEELINSSEPLSSNTENKGNESEGGNTAPTATETPAQVVNTGPTNTGSAGSARNAESNPMLAAAMKRLEEQNKYQNKNNNSNSANKGNQAARERVIKEIELLMEERGESPPLGLRSLELEKLKNYLEYTKKKYKVA